METRISKQHNDHSGTYYDIQCGTFGLIVTKGSVFIGVFCEDDFSPEQVVTLGGIIKLAGEAAEQLKHGDQTVLDLLNHENKNSEA